MTTLFDPIDLGAIPLKNRIAMAPLTRSRAVEGEALVRLAGMPQDYLLNQLMAFRNGQRPATIMHQITRGYSQEQLETVAAYFAAQK